MTGKRSTEGTVTDVGGHECDDLSWNAWVMRDGTERDGVGGEACAYSSIS
jgi:hypothetical protein